MRRCKGCGATFYQGESVCPYCGTDLITGAPPSPGPGPEREHRQEPREHEPWEKSSRRDSSFKDGFRYKKGGYRWPPSGSGKAEGPPPLNIFKDQRRRDLIESILAMTLGTFGAQWFYRGKPVRGIICLLFMWTGIPSILGIVEGVVLLRRVLDDTRYLP